jgi:hypothetical protein
MFVRRSEGYMAEFGCTGRSGCDGERWLRQAVRIRSGRRQRVGGGKRVRLRRHSDNRQQEHVLRVRHPLLLRSGGVGVNAVGATVRGGHGDVDQLSRQGIQSTITAHDYLDAFPGPFERRGIVGERPPEVVHKVRFASASYVVEDGLTAGSLSASASVQMRTVVMAASVNSVDGGFRACGSLSTILAGIELIPENGGGDCPEPGGDQAARRNGRRAQRSATRWSRSSVPTWIPPPRQPPAPAWHRHEVFAAGSSRRFAGYREAETLTAVSAPGDRAIRPPSWRRPARIRACIGRA